jgi:hypothetical protein
MQGVDFERIGAEERNPYRLDLGAGFGDDQKAENVDVG